MRRAELIDLNGFSEGRRSRQFHAGGGEARHLPIIAEPYDPPPRNEAGRAAADADHPQRRADSGRRAAFGNVPADAGEHRCRADLARGTAGQTCGNNPDHYLVTRGNHRPLASAEEVPAGLSGHPCRTQHRLQRDRYREGTVRCRSEIRRSACQGHGGRPNWPGAAHVRGRFARLFCRASGSPRAPHDLANHNCINLRTRAGGSLQRRSPCSWMR
jgi:hypothetical protein